MQIFRIEDMKGGWMAGNFTPSAYRTEDFEVGYKIHKKGESWPVHYHKEVTEITFLLKGMMRLQGEALVSGDIFVLQPNEIADPEFLEDCEVFVIKSRSVIGDKYEL